MTEPHESWELRGELDAARLAEARALLNENLGSEIAKTTTERL